MIKYSVKSKKTAYQIFLILLLVLQIFTNGYASDAFFEIEFDIKTSTVRVSGNFTADSAVTNRRNFAFQDTVAGNDNLAKRISEIQLFDKFGKLLEVKKFADGEYVATNDYNSWKYVVNLTPPKVASAAAHFSWLGANEGILMTDDMLPLFVVGGNPASASVKLNNLNDLQVLSTNFAGSQLMIDDLSKGIIYIGKNFRQRMQKLNGVELNLAISGDWLFTDDDVSQIMAEIFREYTKVFGSAPVGSFRLTIMKLPETNRHGEWQAETRGKNITLLSSDMPFRPQSLQRLHEQLRHEIFHFWIPNGLNLKGNYAWFYEGFALYQSLKTAVELNRIRFEDFLDTLTRAYSIDVRQSPRRPLISPENRSIGIADTQTYARGMVIAFLLDVALLRESKGRTNISDILRQIFSRHSNALAEDGNTAVIRVLGQNQFVNSYIFGSELFNIDRELAGSGIKLEISGRSSSFRSVQKPTGREKEILNRLGYNNWRKISGNSKK